MAVKLIDQLNPGLLGFWEIEETTEQLLDLLRPDREELLPFYCFRNESRKREWLSVRLLLKQMTGSNSGIQYDPAGKPLLTGISGQISISHSTGCVAIYYHPTEQTGIDIECISRNSARVAPKFLAGPEIEDSTRNGLLSNKELMLRWCAKEAVFKMIPYSEIDFAKQILCSASPFLDDQGAFSATFSIKGTSTQIPLAYRLLGEILMVWGTFPI